MSAPTFLAQARQRLAVGTSLFALLINLGAPFHIRRTGIGDTDDQDGTHRLAD